MSPPVFEDETKLRDHLAGLAMQSLIADMDNVGMQTMCDALGEELPDTPSGTPVTPLQAMREWLELFPRYVAHRAYSHADAMMRYREKE